MLLVWFLIFDCEMMCGMFKKCKDFIGPSWTRCGYSAENCFIARTALSLKNESQHVANGVFAWNRGSLCIATRPWYTYCCKYGWSKEYGLNVAPFVDDVFGLHVDAFGGGHGHCSLVVQQLDVNVFAMNHRIPATIKYKTEKILPFQNDEIL